MQNGLLFKGKKYTLPAICMGIRNEIPTADENHTISVASPLGPI